MQLPKLIRSCGSLPTHLTYAKCLPMNLDVSEWHYHLKTLRSIGRSIWISCTSIENQSYALWTRIPNSVLPRFFTRRNHGRCVAYLHDALGNALYWLFRRNSCWPGSTVHVWEMEVLFSRVWYPHEDSRGKCHNALWAAERYHPFSGRSIQKFLRDFRPSRRNMRCLFPWNRWMRLPYKTDYALHSWCLVYSPECLLQWWTYRGNVKGCQLWSWQDWKRRIKCIKRV